MQAAVSHSGAESEAISQDASARMEREPASPLWDLFCGIFFRIPTPRRNFQRSSGMRHSPYHSVDVSFGTVDHFHLTLQKFQWVTNWLFILGDSEALNRMVIERSPRFEAPLSLVLTSIGYSRINMNTTISIRWVRTTEQLADMWTKGAFTTIQWKSLMRQIDVHTPLKFIVKRSPFRKLVRQHLQSQPEPC